MSQSFEQSQSPVLYDSYGNIVDEFSYILFPVDNGFQASFDAISEFLDATPPPVNPVTEQGFYECPFESESAPPAASFTRPSVGFIAQEPVAAKEHTADQVLPQQVFPKQITVRKPDEPPPVSERPIPMVYCFDTNLNSVKPKQRKRLPSASEEKIHKCAYCPKAFYRSHDHRRHERVHTGDRPYACLGCHRSYKRVDARYRHWVANPICYILDMIIMGNTAEGLRRKRRMKNSLAKNGFSRLAIAAAIEF